MAKPALVAPQFTDTQVKLIDSFVILAADIGIANVTLQKVANHAKVAFGTVRYHFAGEDNLDLTQAAIFHVLQRGQAYIEKYLQNKRMASSATFNGVESYIEGTFQWLKDHRHDFSFLTYFYYMGTSHMKLVLKNDFFLESARTRVDNIVHEAIGRGFYEKPADTRTAILQIHALLVGSGIIACTETRKEAFKEQLHAAIDGVNKILVRVDKSAVKSKTVLR